jgi:ubiquinone/menaquinone biosynthesis C-methylase UbiE
VERVDYDERQHVVCDRGRALTEPAEATWRAAFARHADARRPLTVLDLGTGTGRFTPLLADEFGGPVYGVEPSERMRAVAQAHRRHAQVTYLPGAADRIPLPDASCDLVVLFLVWHHLPDRPAAAAEIARVLQPRGRVLVCSSFSDRPAYRLWHRFFPAAEGVEARMFPTLGAVLHDFAAAGLTQIALEEVWQELAPNFTEYADRLRLRAISTFEYLTEEDISSGFATLDAAVATAEDSTPVMGNFDILALAKTSPVRLTTRLRTHRP